MKNHFIKGKRVFELTSSTLSIVMFHYSSRFTCSTQVNNQFCPHLQNQNGFMDYPNGYIADEKYLERRRRNNIAVRKSRERQKEKMNSLTRQIDSLEQERRQLKRQISSSKAQFDALLEVYNEACARIAPQFDEYELNESKHFIGL